MVREVRQFVRRPINELGDSREPQLMAGIISDFRTINGHRGKLALFKLDDKTGTLDARADEALINANRHLFKDDELVIIQGKLQNDRFSGGLQLTVNQIWDLPTARCRFGKFLRVSMHGATDQAAPDVRRLVQEFPPQREETPQGPMERSLPVRMSLQRHYPEGTVAVDLQLGDEARFYPADAALTSWSAQVPNGRAEIVYDASA